MNSLPILPHKVDDSLQICTPGQGNRFKLARVIVIKSRHQVQHGIAFA
jgi:hypothetical protein